MKTNEAIAIIGDTHFPYHHKSCLDWIYKSLTDLQKKEGKKLTHVIQQGDLFDQYSFSRFQRDPNWTSPADELASARSEAEAFWKSVQKIAPKAQCHQVIGNHDIRIAKKAMSHLGEIISLLERPIQNLYTFSGVKTQKTDKDELILKNIMFIHGYSSRLGDHLKRNPHVKGVVCGHSHKGGVFFEQIGNETKFELNAGFVADEHCLPLMYRPQTTSKWTLGYGLIDHRGPRFIHYSQS